MARRRRSSRGSSVNDQGSGLEPSLNPPADASGSAHNGGPEGAPRPGTAPPPGATVLGKEPIMSQSPSSEGAPPPSLVGSLSVFVLSDVLSWLASTSQTGEVRVVGEQVDGRLWLADGQLSNAHVGAARTIGQAVFELAR